MLSFVRQLRQQNIFTFGQMRAGDEDGEQAFCNLLTIASFLDTVLFQLYLHRVLRCHARNVSKGVILQNLHTLCISKAEAQRAD